MGLTEKYDGTTWTEVNNTTTSKTAAAGGGIQTSAFQAGGNNPGAILDSAEEYDGTCWSEENDLNQARDQLTGAGTVSTAALVFGGRFHPSSAVALT